jgi:hypothetical protein
MSLDSEVWPQLFLRIFMLDKGPENKIYKANGVPDWDCRINNKINFNLKLRRRAVPCLLNVDEASLILQIFLTVNVVSVGSMFRGLQKRPTPRIVASVTHLHRLAPRRSFVSPIRIRSSRCTHTHHVQISGRRDGRYNGTCSGPAVRNVRERRS